MIFNPHSVTENRKEIGFYVYRFVILVRLTDNQSIKYMIMKSKAILRLVFLLLLLAFTANCQRDYNLPPPIMGAEINQKAETPSATSDSTEYTRLSDDAPTTVVYICGPKGAKRYHYSNTCCGLKRCTHEIVETTVEDAENFGLTLCKYE
jgi:hypothetical protein